MGKKKDDEDDIKLAAQLGKAAREKDEKKLAELAAKVPKDKDGIYQVGKKKK